MTINQPEFYLEDEMQTIVTAVKTALGLANLNFQFDLVDKVNEVLTSWSKQESDKVKKFPLVWLIQPYTIHRGIPERPDLYGELQNGMLVIANSSKPDKKAAARETDNFRAVLYPIYRELLNQFYLSTVFETGQVEQIDHYFTKRYYWGEAQKSILDDVVDCCVISNLKLSIYNNYNCTSFKNF